MIAGLLILGCGALIVVALISGGRIAQAGDPSDSTAKWLSRWRWVGIGLGIVLATGTVAAGDLGRGPLLASVAFGLGTLSGILVGELLVRPALGTRRRASVQPRSVKAYGPRVLGPVVVAATVALILLMIATTAGGSADDMQRAGRSLTYIPDATRSASTGPWPGSYYTFPAAAALLVAGIVTIVVLVIVAHRPATGDLVADTAQRRRSAEAVTAAWGVAAGIPLVGFCITAANALIVIGVAPQWWRMAGWSLVAIAAFGLALVLWCLTALLLPSRQSAAASTPA